MLTQIAEYFAKEQVSAIDVVFLALLVNFLTWGLKIFSKTGRQLFDKLKKHFSNIYRKRIKRQLNFKELLEVERKIKSGIPVKDYERIAYDKQKQKLVEIVKKSNIGESINNVSKILNDTKRKL